LNCLTVAPIHTTVRRTECGCHKPIILTTRCTGPSGQSGAITGKLPHESTHDTRPREGRYRRYRRYQGPRRALQGPRRALQGPGRALQVPGRAPRGPEGPPGARDGPLGPEGGFPRSSLSAECSAVQCSAVHSAEDVGRPCIEHQ
jgi:hypothetical protein